MYPVWHSIFQRYPFMTTVSKLFLCYLGMLVVSTRKPTSELVRNYFEANGNEGVNHEAPVPEALISTIGQRHKFCVKVTEHNFSGKTRSLTVTKILPLDTPPATESSEGNQTTAASEETSINHVDSAEESKRTCDSTELEKAKRPKRGD
ncbi:unnamed protein product [Brassica oleracea]